MKRNSALGLLIICALAAFSSAKAEGGREVELAKDGRAIPIIVAADAAAGTVDAAKALAGFIERISGAKPEVISEVKKTMPSAAIWVGAHPELSKAMPGVEFVFSHPEEIRIVSRGGNVAILGRDLSVGGTQREFGTVNAVYTFAQKYLGIRWLWPGALGEDFPSQKTVTVPEADYAFHPVFVQRDIFRNLDRSPSAGLSQWCRAQRLYFDSFDFPVDHAFSDWWEKYSQTHPEYFALQPDGTRGTFPDDIKKKKLCDAEPAVWNQWLLNVGEALKKDPSEFIFNGSPNDSTNNGICIDPRSMAWDHPKGELWQYSWRGVSKEYPAMSNRYVTFWNKLAEMLKAKYPDKDYYVAGMAYGPSKPVPIDLPVAKNIVIGYVGAFPVLDDARRAEERASFLEWSKLTRKLVYRPNLMWYTGGFNAVPAVTFKKTIEDFRFLGENGCRGVILDTLPDHWATQGPMYYLMGQLAWDPLQDGEAVLADYFSRAFGPAAGSVRKYFELMEKTHNSIMDRSDWKNSGRMAKLLAEFMLAEAYTPEVLRAGRALLEQAGAEAASSPLYRDRVGYIVKGLDFTDRIMETMAVMNRVRKSGGTDAAAVARAIELVAARDAAFAAEDAEAKKLGTYSPISTHRFNVTYVKARVLEDYLGPVSDAFKNASVSGVASTPTPRPSAAAPAASSARGSQFRWTGREGNGQWGTLANWEVLVNGKWGPADQSPGTDSVIILDDASPEGEQALGLTANTTIGRIVVAASAGRSFVIQTRDDADSLGLDSDSGMLFKLQLSDAVPISQEPASGANLRIASDLILRAEKPVIRLNSRHGARIEIGGALSPAGQNLQITKDEGATGVWDVKTKGAALKEAKP